MKAKVLREFKDKYSGICYKPKEIIEVSEERYEEILQVAPLVEKVKEPTKKAKNTAK